MLQVNDYVTLVDTEKPVGLVQELIGDNAVVVRWGVSDKRIFTETISPLVLTKVNYEIVSPDDITKLKVIDDKLYLED